MEDTHIIMLETWRRNETRGQHSFENVMKLLTGTPNLTAYANWCRAVVGIAFGELVPQCSGPFADAVAFTAGAFFSECVDQIDLLINGTFIPGDRGANHFGDYITERCQELNSID